MKVSLRDYFEALRVADQRAIDAALEAAKEKADSHNALIEAMERQQGTFVTKSAAYSALVTVIAVLGLLVTYYATVGGTP